MPGREVLSLRERQKCSLPLKEFVYFAHFSVLFMPSKTSERGGFTHFDTAQFFSARLNEVHEELLYYPRRWRWCRR